MKNILKRLNKIIIIYCLIILLFLYITTINVQALDSENKLESNSELEIQKYEFTESIETFNNPDMGIYRPTFIRCKAIGDWSNTRVQYAGGLVHLRLGIQSFSKAGNGVQDYDITEEHIQKLNQYMNQIRDAGGTVIIRFAYDDFEGKANLEPDIDQILKHIEQLQPFFEQNEDIIACVETGLLGPWGEQHTSKIVTKENIKKITDKLLEVVPESRTVNVRTPNWYCAVTGADINSIDKDNPR